MHIGVLGAGSWGTTLAAVLVGNGHDVTLWSWNRDDAETMRSTGRNRDYLPDLELPPALGVTDDLDEASTGMDMLVVSTPSQFVRSVLASLDVRRMGTPLVVNVAKGIEKGSLLRMSEVVAQVLPGLPASHYTVLSGPSHAEEVSAQKATTVVAASLDADVCQTVQNAFMTEYFRVYSSTDVVGVEIGGSLKNVIAIGAGIIDGGGYGDNTKAALITRGIAEMRRLGMAMGADPHTFAGLSGLGDLIVTTMSRHSRNRFVGEELGRGRTLGDILDSMKMVAEGVETTRSAHELALRLGVEMPITHQVHAILFERKEPVRALRDLMTRAAKDEVWS